MANDYTMYRATVSTLTPLHIGNGRVLLHNYDYAIHQGKTWRINEDALLDVQAVDDPRIAEQLAQTPPAQLLTKDDFKPESDFFHYVLAGTPRSQQAGAELREQIKDAFYRPYLPGSSLKGALRTAIVWFAFGARKLTMRDVKPRLGRNPAWAAQAIEQELLGRDPNHDLLRALHVSDSQPIGPEQLILVNAQVVTRGGMGSPIEVEAIRPDTELELTIKLDNALFSDWAGKLGLRERADWLQHLPAVVRRHTACQVKDELTWYNGRKGAEAARNFYTELSQLNLPENTCVLRMGWGGGWDSKTLGSHLRSDPAFLEGIIRDYHMTRGRRQPGDPFPKSRRVSVRRVRANNGAVHDTIGLPLGWVLLTLTKVHG